MNIFRALQWIGTLSFLSTLFYVITGMGWWTPITEGTSDELRGALLMLLHLIGMITGVLATVHECTK